MAVKELLELALYLLDPAQSLPWVEEEVGHRVTERARLEAQVAVVLLILLEEMPVDQIQIMGEWVMPNQWTVCCVEWAAVAVPLLLVVMVLVQVEVTVVKVFL
jgi:hypothetical protein